jgi:hypothetical protein
MRLVFVLLVVAAFAACKDESPKPPPIPAPPPDEPSEPAKKVPPTTEKPPVDPRVEAARGALLPLKKSLKEALTGAMKEGPEKAVAVCHADAGKLTAAAAKEGVTLGRTSHKLRNPKNAQADWMRLPYAKMREGEAAVPFMVATLPDGSFGYMEPIVTQPVCLTCHGTEIPDGVKKLLDEKYPKDQARGFAAGELRGAWWVVMPANQKADAPD